MQTVEQSNDISFFVFLKTALILAVGLSASGASFAGNSATPQLQSYIKAFNTDADDAFGRVVAIDDDTLVIGAISEDGSTGGGGEDNTLPASGAAYVFERESQGGADAWSASAYLKGSNTGSSDQFGRQVAISGDLIAVSAIFEDSSSAKDPDDNSLPNSGAVYVFQRDAFGNWVEEAFLKAPNADEGDRFGSSLALSGDLLVVGTPFEDSSATGIDQDDSDNSAPDAGAAYVFQRNEAGEWNQQAYLKASNAEANDQFAISLAISGTSIIVGAYFEDSDAAGVNGPEDNNDRPNSGAAYVFKREDGTGSWFQDAYLKAFDPQAGSSYGVAVAISDQTALVGAPGDIRNGPGGAAYLFSQDTGQWLEESQLKASNNDAFDQFGTSVSLFGDRALVGAHREDGGDGNPMDNSAEDAGAGYLFERQPSGHWTETAYLKSSNPDADDRFGLAVAMTDNTFVLGVPEEDSAATQINGDASNNDADRAGAAFIFIEVQDAVFSSRFEL